MENEAIELPATADTAEAEKREDTAAELKKFKDAEALQKAYLSLEAEFTRRSQRLKELEAALAAQSAPQKDNAQTAAADGGGDSPKARITDEDRQQIIGDFLKSVAQNRAAPQIIAGGGVAAPKTSPRTVRQAGALAERFLKL